MVYPHVHPLPPGKIYGSNLNLLLARLSELGIPETGGEHAGDDPQAVAETMERLLGCCDALITTGGVSVGDKDIFHQALPLLGAETVFWRLNVKPGTPALYSTRRGKPILSLSGNPFAAAATFELLARPMLCALSGEERLLPQRRSARLDTAFSKASPCRRFLRGRWQDGRSACRRGTPPDSWPLWWAAIAWWTFRPGPGRWSRGGWWRYCCCSGAGAETAAP